MSTPRIFLNLLKITSWCKSSMTQLVNILCWTCCSQTKKMQTEMKSWSSKSWEGEKYKYYSIKCTTQYIVTAWHFRRADFTLPRDLLGRISQKTTTEGEGKALAYWLTFKGNILKAQYAGVQAGLTMDQCERKGNLWLSSNVKQNTCKVEAGVGGIYRHYLTVHGWS